MTTNRPLRALIVIRLSRVTDATTSPERQLKDCREVCKQRGYEEVGIAEDLDISGAVNPFDLKKRPHLARWLTQEHHAFDVIVVYRVDRLTRSIRHLQELMHWADDHGKLVVSATEPHFDTSSPFAPVVIALMGTVAQMELEAIRERNASAFKHNFSKGKYRGGVPPFGYVPVRDDSGDWRLVQDAAQVEVIREVVERVLAGEPLRAIAHDLTRRRVPTPRDAFAAHQGRDPKGYAWHSSRLKAFLTSQTLLGRVVSREQLTDAHGRPQRDAKGHKLFGDDVLVRGDDGSPVVRAEPILSRDVFQRVQAELETREVRSDPTSRTTGLLLRIIYCGVCGSPAYRLKGGPGRKPRYRCASHQGSSVQACGNKTIALDYADAEVERQILQNMGPLERKRRVWFAGNDHTDELSEIDAALTDIAEVIGTGQFKRGTTQRALLDERLAHLTTRQTELASVPSQPPGWVYEPTGETLADWWADASDEEKNIWLRQYGFRYEWRSHSGDNGRIVVDEFNQVGDLTLDLDADMLLGPLGDIVAALSEGSLPDDDGE
ncbi:MAG: recombinase family protein [Mycobacterium sp.]|nr:MAG: recombinase family protein [Mycobacterium sp.]